MVQGEQGKPPRQISIFWVLSVLLVLLVVIPLVSYSWRSISASKDYIEESLRERQLKAAIPAAAHISNLMDEYRQRLKDLAATFEVFSNDSDTRKITRTSFRGGFSAATCRMTRCSWSTRTGTEGSSRLRGADSSRRRRPSSPPSWRHGACGRSRGAR